MYFNRFNIRKMNKYIFVFAVLMIIASTRAEDPSPAQIEQDLKQLQTYFDSWKAALVACAEATYCPEALNLQITLDALILRMYPEA